MDRHMCIVAYPMDRFWLVICDGGRVGVFADLWDDEELLPKMEDFLQSMAAVPLPGPRTPA
jgi:hypothetical protein